MKFKILLAVSTVLIFSALAYNIFEEVFFRDIEGYVQRRLYYERVISRKGLDLHKGMHWKEKKD